MSEMVDRVAGAIINARESEQDSWAQARVAIETMREHFVKLGEDGSSCYDFAIQEIDEALSRCRAGTEHDKSARAFLGLHGRR